MPPPRDHPLVPSARPRPASPSAPTAPRRFRITQQDDEAQFERTMRQFLTSPDDAPEATEPPA